jgi:DNA-binding GntR family transcriptional regulator
MPQYCLIASTADPRRSARPASGGVASVHDISGGRHSAGAVVLGAPPPSENGILTADDIRGVYRLLKIIETDLARRSSPLLRPGDFERIERAADLIVSPKTDNHTGAMMHGSYLGGLLLPAASNVELGTMLALVNQISAHFGAELQRLDIHHADLPCRDDAYHRLIEVFRDTDPATAAAAMLKHIEYDEQLALRLFAEGDRPESLAIVRKMTIH